MSPDSFKNNITYKLFANKSYIYIYKQDLVVNNQLGLIHKPNTKKKKTSYSGP